MMHQIVQRLPNFYPYSLKIKNCVVCSHIADQSESRMNVELWHRFYLFWAIFKAGTPVATLTTTTTTTTITTTTTTTMMMMIVMMTLLLLLLLRVTTTATTTRIVLVCRDLSHGQMVLNKSFDSSSGLPKALTFKVPGPPDRLQLCRVPGTPGSISEDPCTITVCSSVCVCWVSTAVCIQFTFSFS